jgi:hypothetical protein
MSRFFLAAAVLLRVKPSDQPRLAESRTHPVRVLSLIALGCLGLLPVQPGNAQTNDPRPTDAVTTMLSAFDKYPIVALGDLHGCQELYDFIATLVRNPDFPNKVNDIVVEFGNALYQDIADRYIASKDVDAAELRQVWRNHTNPIVFDSPVYERFFKVVRETNQTLPEGKRWRVLLGDPPIDWSKTNTNKDWGRMLFQRDPHFVGVVEKEVLAKGRRALLIIGGAHLVRGAGKSNVTGRIESEHPGSMSIVIPHDGFRERNEELEPRLAGWKVGSLALLKGTWLGALHPRLRWPQMKNLKLSGASPPKAEPKLEDVADAWLYVGPRDLLTEALPFPGIYRDEYWNELKRRHLIMWGQPLESSDQFNSSGRYYVKPR